MSEPEVSVVPISQPEMTEKQVEYSVKIARNQLRKELEARYRALDKEDSRLQKKYRDAVQEYMPFWVEYAHNQILLTFCNESKYQCLVSAFNLIAPNNNDKIDVIQDMIINANTSQVIRNLLEGNYNLESDPAITNTVKITAAIRLAAISPEATKQIEESGWPDVEDIQYSIPISYDIDEQLLDDIQKCATIKAHWQAVQKQTQDVYEQLDSLDNTLEDIEAQILMASLNKTTEGAAAASITTDIITGVLGTLPALPNKE